MEPPIVLVSLQPQKYALVLIKHTQLASARYRTHSNHAFLTQAHKRFAANAEISSDSPDTA
jgi:hypothetical protein